MFVKLATSTNLEDAFKSLGLNLNVLKIVFLMGILVFACWDTSKYSQESAKNVPLRNTGTAKSAQIPKFA